MYIYKQNTTMRSIRPELTAPLFEYFGNPKQTKIATIQPYYVPTYSNLVELVAGLSFKNKDYLLYYRGQSENYKNKAGSSSFYPSIYRGEYLPQNELNSRFSTLKEAGNKLAHLFEERRIEGYKEVRKRRVIQWSILQHYEVCPTPLLDITHSLRVACSFAMLGNKTEKAYISIFGMPYLTNRISINSEHDIINIRLLSICPPTALRPYFQEGYLVGTDGITSKYDTKSELDFNNRLIATFEIPNNESFWDNGFRQMPLNSLYPANDPIEGLCEEVRNSIVK